MTYEDTKGFNWSGALSTTGLAVGALAAFAFIQNTKSPFATVESDKITVTSFKPSQETRTASLQLAVGKDTRVEADKIPERLSDQVDDLQTALVDKYPNIKVALGSVSCREIAPQANDIFSYTCRAETMPVPTATPTPTK